MRPWAGASAGGRSAPAATPRAWRRRVSARRSAPRARKSEQARRIAERRSAGRTMGMASVGGDEAPLRNAGRVQAGRQDARRPESPAPEYSLGWAIAAAYPGIAPWILGYETRCVLVNRARGAFPMP